MHLLFAGIACKIHFLVPSDFDKKMSLNYDKFCPLKMMAFMIIKGNIICWHFLKALPSADSFHCILRAITVYFWDEVFPLRFEGISYNSVIKRKFYKNHEKTSCFVYIELEVSVYHFLHFAILLLFGLPTLILMMIQIQALAD